MDKQTYLRKLRRALKDLPPEVVNEIIADYQEHFDSGKAQGKSEQQISSELGNPKEVAQEYLGYAPSKKHKENVLTVSKILYFLIFLVGLFTILPHLLKITTSVLSAVFLFLLIIILIGVVIAVIMIWYIKNKINHVKDGKFFNGNFTFNSDSSDYHNIAVDKRFIFDSPNINKIKVTSALESVHIDSKDINEIQIHLYGNSNINYDHMIVSEEGNTLSINTLKEMNMNTNHSKVKLEITVPNNREFDLDAKVTMGNIVINNSNINCVVSTKTGEIKINAPQDHIDLDAKMGNIKLSNFYGSGKIKVSMGNCTFKNSEMLKGTIEISTKMGSVKSNPSKIRFKYDSEHNKQIVFDSSPHFIKIDSKMGSINFE